MFDARFFFARFLSPLLIAGLSLGSVPAYALRPMPDKAGLEENFRSQAGLEEQVTVEGPNGPITWTVPKSVKEAVEFLRSENPSMDEAAQRIRDGFARVEHTFGDPVGIFSLESGLFSWALNNFSNPDFALSDAERVVLSKAFLEFFHILFVAQMETPLDIFSFTIRREDALEPSWYLLVRLLVLQQKLEQTSPRTKLVEEHLNVIASAYKQIIGSSSGAFQRVDPYNFFEGRLIRLGQTQPLLMPMISGILQNWDEIGEGFLEVDVFTPPEKQALFAPASSEEVAEEVKGQQKLARQLSELRNVLTPRSGETVRAWDHPIAYLADKAAPADVLFLGASADIPYEQQTGDLPNCLLFQLDLLDRLAGTGFRQWGFGAAGDYLRTVQEFSARQKDRRTLAELVEVIQGYLDTQGAVPLRTYLALPQAEEPASVTVYLNFWERLREIKQKHGVQVRLFLGELGKLEPEASFLQWIQEGKGKQVVVEWAWYERLQAAIRARTIFRLRQYSAEAHYGADKFDVIGAFRHLPFLIGDSRGWGDRQSAAIPIKENPPLRQLFEEREDLWGSSFDAVAWSWRHSFGATSDALVVTAESDEEDTEGPRVPDAEDVEAPVGTRDPVLAPASGLEDRLANVLAVLTQAVPLRSSVLVIEAPVISRRTGLAKFVARIPRFGTVVLVGKGSAAAKEAAVRNPHLIVVDSDDLMDLAFTLTGLEEADRIVYVGEKGNALRQILPTSMNLSVLDPKTGLEQILLNLGFPPAILDEIDASGLEEAFARLHSA